jgi:hypothetical protein
MIEEINKNQENKNLEEFRNEIKNLINEEIIALKQGEQVAVHFITNPQSRETSFKAEDLTEEDMEMYNRIKNKDGSLTLQDFKRYKKKIFPEGQILKTLNSRQIFAAYLSNLILYKEGKIVFIDQRSQK